MKMAGSSHADPVGHHSPKTHPMFHRVFPARPMAVRGVLHDVHSRFHNMVSDDTLGRLELVLAEVMNNVAEHGGGDEAAGNAPLDALGAETSIHLCIVQHESGLSCAVTDDGVTLPEHCLSPRDLPGIGDDGLPEGGFGWFLIQDLAQALCYYRADQRNFLAFSIPFASDRHEAAAITMPARG